MLKLALDKTQQFLRARKLLGGQLRPLGNALVPFGGYKCMGRMERPVFACRQAMQRHMRRLKVHYTSLWSRRLARPGRGRREAFLDLLASPPGWSSAAPALQPDVPAAAALLTQPAARPA